MHLHLHSIIQEYGLDWEYMWLVASKGCYNTIHSESWKRRPCFTLTLKCCCDCRQRGEGPVREDAQHHEGVWPGRRVQVAGGAEGPCAQRGALSLHSR